MKTGRKKSLANLIAEWVLEHPKVCFSISLVLIIACISPINSLKSDYGIRIWFRTTDPLIAELDALEQKFGNDERIAIGINSKTGMFSNKNLHAIDQITKKVWTLPDVVRVDSLTNFNYTEAQGDDLQTEPFYDSDKVYTPDELEQKMKLATTDPLLLNQMISKDGHTAMIFGTLRPDLQGTLDYKMIVIAIKQAMAPFEKENDFSFHYVGTPTVQDAYRQVSEDDMKIMIPLNFAIMIFLLYFIFRTIEGVVIPIVLVGITILMTFGISAFLGFKFDNLSAAIPGILISICMADTIHILSTYYRHVRAGLTTQAAGRVTLAKNLLPTFLTSLSTMIGFISLTQTDLIPIKKLGYLASAGTMLAWLLTIFLVVPLLIKIPYRPVFFREKTVLPEKLANAYLQWIDKYKRLIIWCSSVIAVVAIAIGMQNKVNSDPLNHFSSNLRLSKDTHYLLGIFNGTGGPQIMVDSGAPDGIKDPKFLRQIQKLTDWIEDKSFVNKVSSIVDIVKHLNKKLHADDAFFYRLPDTKEEVAEILLLYSMGLPQGMDLNNQMSLDNRFLRLGILWSIHDAERSLHEIEGINKKAEELGLKISITGKLTLYHRMTGYIVKTFFFSITMALILIAIMMFLFLRSPKLGIISLFPNVVPLCIGAGLMTVINTPIDIGTALVISVCLGIAVDDTIHFLIHFKAEFDKGQDTYQSILKVLIHTSPALVFTTVVLTIGFGVFSFANFTPNVNFGILCSIILSFALVTDLVYLPALLLAFPLKSGDLTKHE